MGDDQRQNQESAAARPRYETDEHAEKRFRGWRLLGVILCVVVALATVSFIVDWLVIGPLEGRVF